MSDPSGATDPYEAVLLDLRAKRDRIDQAITTIEAIRGEMDGGGRAKRPEAAPTGTPSEETAPDGVFLGMTIVDATKKLLAQRRKTIGNGALASALHDGGLILNSKEPSNTINSVLTRRFNEVGDIIRVSRGVWGLKEWYPHTNFKKRDDSQSDQPERQEVSKSVDPSREAAG